MFKRSQLLPRDITIESRLAIKPSRTNKTARRTQLECFNAQTSLIRFMCSQDFSCHGGLNDYLGIQRRIEGNYSRVVFWPEEALHAEGTEFELVYHLPVLAAEEDRNEVLVVFSLCNCHELVVWGERGAFGHWVAGRSYCSYLLTFDQGVDWSLYIQFWACNYVARVRSEHCWHYL